MIKMIKLILPAIVILNLLMCPAQQPKSISIKEIDGRTWLIDLSGQPFFAHGVTHINNKKHGVDPKKIGDALKELGFNSYGYGTPPALKNDMP